MCGVTFNEVKKELLRDPETKYEYRKLQTGTDFTVMVTKAASAIAEKRGVPAEDIDKEIAEKSGIGFDRYMEILSDGEPTLSEVQQIAMTLGYDAKVVFVPHNEE